MHIYVCKSGCVHAIALGWKSEDNLGCQSSLSTLFETVFLFFFFFKLFSITQARIAGL